MEIDKREALKQIVGNYLESEFPDLSDEYKIVFDDVYDTIEYQLRQKLTESKTEGQEVGLGFDAGVVSGTIMSITCWIGIKLLLAATKVTARKNIPEVLSEMEKKLISFGCKPEMVHGLRKRLEEYLMETFS